MKKPGRRKRVLVVLALLLLGALAGVAGSYVQHLTGQTWTRYLPLFVVSVLAPIVLFRAGVISPKK
ncbi:hypothetical protein [Lentzea sp. NBRC 102530]|uniref:hypothetical protein n=1 Tax=Lentzea sp. NBRC 102530 TaxID=3032201 RepID=UPI00255646A3|nr:hypothetical protein [Lentzea sp. NBRC 102530]